ncbi:MAG: BatD family protein [Muribaculaceae bacterium]|nr:BatD family protein [Muribaculaceae bacterium]
MKKLLITLALILGTVAATIAQTSFQVVPPRNVIAGNVFYVTYRLTNGNGNGLNAPAISGCKLLSNRPGVSTMQSVQIINGNQTSTTTEDYTFTYRAEKEGTYTIPSASVTVDGKTYQTKQASFKVLPPDSSQPAGGNRGGYGGGAHVDDIASQDSQQKISKDDIFVRVILNKNHAYEGEAIECTLKLYTKFERINSFMMTSPPTFDGFLIEELNTQAALNDVEHYNGQNYITAVLKKCIIYPQKAGKLTINSGKYDLSVVQLERVSNGFFISARPIEKEVSLQPFTQTVNITELPAGAPASFTGAVGQFKFESRLSNEQPRSGEAISLRYIITGTGNIKFLKAPKPSIPNEFEQYTPKTEENTRVAGNNMTGTITTDYTIVPQSVGEFKIPSLDFTYFDPSRKEYVTVSAPGYTLNVAKGSGTTMSSEQHEIEAKNTDIHHIKLGEKNLSHDNRPIIRFWWYWAIFGCLLAIMLGSFWIYRRQLKMDADVAGRRTSRANKVARKRLKAAEGFMKAHKSDQFYEEMLKAVWGYLSDKLNMPASQLSRQNIVDTLGSRGVEPALTDKVIKLLDNCEMARYTPDSSLDSSVEAIYNEGCETINAMEKIRLGR